MTHHILKYVLTLGVFGVGITGMICGEDQGQLDTTRISSQPGLLSMTHDVDGSPQEAPCAEFLQAKG